MRPLFAAEMLNIKHNVRNLHNIRMGLQLQLSDRSTLVVHARRIQLEFRLPLGAGSAQRISETNN